MEAQSELLARNKDLFQDKCLLACGYLVDNYLLDLATLTKQMIIWCTDYKQFVSCATSLGLNVQQVSLGCILLTDNQQIVLLFAEKLHYLPATLLASVDLVLLQIAKAKEENRWYLTNCLSLLPKDSVPILVVGGNNAGIRGTQTMLKEYGNVRKIDNARKCVLLSLVATKNVTCAQQFTTYEAVVNDCTFTVASMPGVFSATGLDLGTCEMLKYFQQHSCFTKGAKVLDVGCGSGVIGAFLHKLDPTLELSACDISAFALACTQETARLNHMPLQVFASDMLAKAKQYDYIVTNPPFHDGIIQTTVATEQLIAEVKLHLTVHGELYLVANAFLPYADALEHNFQQSEVVVKTNKFKLYHTLNC